MVNLTSVVSQKYVIKMYNGIHSFHTLIKSLNYFLTVIPAEAGIQ
jgi:hypothetical protein